LIFLLDVALVVIVLEEWYVRAEIFTQRRKERKVDPENTSVAVYLSPYGL
jgi:hypothetical protein